MPNFNNDILISNIKQLMKDNGVSQLQLAKDLLSNQSNISKCLSGNKTISIEFAYQIAHRFDVTIDYLCSDHSEDPTNKVDERPITNSDSPAQILIQVCTALATIFKTSASRTNDFERREEVFAEEYDDYGCPMGRFYQKHDQFNMDPVIKYTSIYFPNYDSIQRSFESSAEADEYFCLLEDYGNALETNMRINEFLRKLTDLQNTYLKNSMSTESYHNAIDDNLATLIRIWDKQ